MNIPVASCVSMVHSINECEYENSRVGGVYYEFNKLVWEMYVCCIVERTDGVATMIVDTLDRWALYGWEGY
jgi:hypothetical protein